LNGGKNYEKGSGMAGKVWQANKSLQNRPLQADTASGFSARHRPQNERPQLAGLAAKTTAAADDVVGLSPCR